MRNVLVTMLLTTALCSPAIMAAPDANEKAINARRGEMQLRSFNAGPLFAMAKGKMAYDAKQASMHANNLSLLTKLNNGAAWPKGSDNKAYSGKTRALPKIWNDSNVGDKGKAYKNAVMSLASSAGNGLDALKSSVSELGKTCKGCHDDFRAEDF
ncbi:MAG: cytochrome c [Gammaproteobacteria bacterium]|nr:cytochrome c [Gammaproteobacteria bacterium]